jgi:hypothetical protein
MVDSTGEARYTSIDTRAKAGADGVEDGDGDRYPAYANDDSRREVGSPKYNRAIHRYLDLVERKKPVVECASDIDIQFPDIEAICIGIILTGKPRARGLPSHPDESCSAAVDDVCLLNPRLLDAVHITHDDTDVVVESHPLRGERGACRNLHHPDRQT